MKQLTKLTLTAIMAIAASASFAMQTPAQMSTHHDKHDRETEVPEWATVYKSTPVEASQPKHIWEREHNSDHDRPSQSSQID